MRKALIIFIYITMCSGVTTAMAYESSESFGLYTNNSLTTDETAEEVAPETVPIDGGTLILIAMAGIYAIRVYTKRIKKSIDR
ncbi:hypothetical protein [uncultured Bacteroides sp.]|uniref:hypothetical protein n=1 Tax=uncultured Bacteroides sp. TaxID=162156 RepID=UPI002AAAF15F|nr:hypothetical protein [uncultured Bacteroides sp.]